MKKGLALLVLAVVVLSMATLTGCKKEEESAPEAAMEKESKTAEQAVKEHPATAKPKDHPAH